jgi:hypothetical protein
MTRAFWMRLGLAAFVLAEGAGAGLAATDVCTDLQARLDTLSRGGGGSADTYRAYDAQVNQQRAALDRAVNDARARGCYGGFFVTQKPNAQCPQLVQSINAMQGSLAQLTATRDQYRVDPFTLNNQRNDVLRLMSLNRCGTTSAYAYPPIGQGGILAAIFGGGMFGNGYFYGSPYGFSNTYRTLCVRSCDGYYFPISFSTTRDRFADDEQTCQAMCPGAQVSLYVHHNPGEEVDSMVSLAGARYSALPNAFQYRTSYDPGCSCGSATTPSLMDQLTAQAAALTPGGPLPPVNIPAANATFYPLPAQQPSGRILPRPSLRPAFTEDPETLAGRAGELVPRPIAGDAGPLVAGVTADGRPIRLVGPEFYIAQ